MSKQVENYLFQEVLGNGQYGQVYKGHNVKTDEIVAIKQMNIEKFKRLPKLYDFIKNEIDILSQINHPHVIRFIEILRTSNNFYLVYEYCNGGDLEHLLKKRKFLPEKEAQDILKQLLSAFKVLCSRNILHRDLKPVNIIFNNNQVKVADFGFCKILEGPQQMTKTMVGSPIYMAPEILKGNEFILGYNYSVKADIWSIGVVYFEMLFGFCPFEDSTIQRLIKQIDQKPLFIPKNINNVSKLSEELLRRMLVVDPHKRIEWNQLMELVIPEKQFLNSNPQIQLLDNPQQQQQTQQPIQQQQIGMRTPINDAKIGFGNQVQARENAQQAQVTSQRENKHMSRGKQENRDSLKIETRQNRTTSVGIPQKNIDQKQLDYRRMTDMQDQFKQPNIMTPMSNKSLYNLQNKEEPLKQIMFDRHKVMFLVQMMKLCVDTSINDSSYRVSFFILNKAKIQISYLINKLSKFQQTSSEYQSFQKIIQDEDKKIQTFYIFFQNQIKNESVNIDSVQKYLIELKKSLPEAKDQMKLILLMKYLLELINFDQFCKNNLNDFCKFDEQRYFTQIQKMTYSQLQHEVFDLIDQQLQLINM